MREGDALEFVSFEARDLGRILQIANIIAGLARRCGQLARDDINMLAIIERTRSHESLALGVSPRGSQALYRAVQALALVEGRDYAIPDDIKRLAVPLFAHRVVINTRTTLVQRRTEVGERIIEEILSQVEVPL